jgi:hypothetical protein
MPIHTKKAAVRNREVSINNQIANIFVNNNGTVLINQDSIPKYESKTATTSLAISGIYQIPLVSSTSGNQVFNKSTNLVYDTNMNKLTVPNLTTTYLPKCSVVPTESSQLVNKAYLDQYLGDYKQIWIYDDFMSGFPGGNLSWAFVPAGSSSSTIQVIPSEPGHPGIVRIQRGNGDSYMHFKLNDNINFTSKTIKCVRFMVRPFAGNSTNIETTYMQMYLGNLTANNPTTNDYSNSAYWCFKSSNKFDTNIQINWRCSVNDRDTIKRESPYTGTLANKWVLFEIELNQQKPSFYITVMGETARTLVYSEPTLTINSNVFIKPYIVSSSITNNSGVGPALDIDYVDILYNKL